MSAYTERDERYDKAAMAGYRKILEIARESPYQSKGNGKQFVDFIVGREGIDKVVKVRVLIDFRGEYFSSFILGSDLPVSVTAPIRNRICFSAKEAYEYIIQKSKELNA